MEEASQEPEPNAWNILKLKNLPEVRGICLVGDQQQLRPPMFSATASPSINGFGQQGTQSLFNRMINSGFPSAQLKMQYRANPDLTELPNQFTNNGTMVNGPSTNRLLLASEWVTSTNNFLSRVSSQMAKVNILPIDVTDGICETDTVLKTRYNLAHVKVVAAYVKTLLDDGVFPKHTIMVVTPYQGQRSAVLDMYMHLSRDTDTKMLKVPEVNTASTMQGREADVIIYDSVLTNVHNFADFGIQQDEHLMNVAHTRARRQFIILCNNSITRGSLSSDWKDFKDPTGRGVKVSQPKPYLIRVVDHYARNGQMISMSSADIALNYAYRDIHSQ